jgi:hypothetical protein
MDNPTAFLGAVFVPSFVFWFTLRCDLLVSVETDYI